MYKHGTAFSIVLIFSALSILGLFFLPLLSVKLQPSIGTDSFTISSNWPGTSPVIVETGLTSKLEGALNTLSGIEKISSATSAGKVTIDIEADKYADNERLRLEISSVIRRLYPALPAGTSYPVISSKTIDEEDEKPLLIYTLRGQYNSIVLQEYAENNIKTSLSIIPGIDHINVYGGTAYEWQISYKPDEIRKLGISPGDIIKALETYYQKQPLGYVFEDDIGTENISSEKKITVNLGAARENFMNEGNVPIKKTGGRIIYLSDITKINRVIQKVSSYYRINGQNAIYIVIYPENGTNSLKLSEDIGNKVARIKTKIPPDYKIETSYDATEYVKTELSKIYKRTFFTLVILIVFVLIASFSFKYSLLIVLSIFTNISLSFILYYLFGIEIHLYSMAGITVSLGLIIDNSIIMADHLIYRNNMKVYTALLASTFTTIASLSVVWFLPEHLRLNLWDFALIIVVNLSVSLIVSLFYIPSLLNLMNFKKIKKAGFKRKKRIIKANNIYLIVLYFLQKHKILAIVLIIFLFGLPVFMLPNKIHSTDLLSSLYNKTLGNEWYVENIKPYINRSLGGSLRLFSQYVFENSYYTEPEETKLYVLGAMPKGATIEQLNNVYLGIEHFVDQYADAIQYHTRIQSPRYAEMAISFDDDTDHTLPYLLKSQLIARSIDFGGVNWDIYGVGKGFSNRTDVHEMINYKIALYGYNYDELERQAQNLQRKLQNHPRVRKVNITGSRHWWEQEKTFEYFIDLNAYLLKYQNLTPFDIYYAFNNRSGGHENKLSLFTNHSYEQINIIAENSFLSDKWELIHQPTGEYGYKLTELLNIEKREEYQTIYKTNQNYIRLVDYQYAGSSKFGMQFLNSVLDEMEKEFPLGYSGEALHHDFSLKEDKISYTILLLLIILIIFFICSILFESLLLPFAIIIMIPTSFIGIFLTFYWFDFNFDQGGYAAFIMLSGLVVNSAIYIINEYNNLKKRKMHKGIPSIQLYLRAFNYKIVPILLTIFSTVFGLIPFVVFGQNEVFWFAFAAGTIGGLVFSIPIIVFYLPIFALRAKKKQIS